MAASVETFPPSTPLRVRLLLAGLVAGLLGGSALTWLALRPAPAPVEHDEASDLPEGVIEIPEPAQRNAGLQTVAVSRATLPAVIAATGVVGPDEARVAHVRPLARGVVEQVAVALGARVAAGQPLLTYDNIELGEFIGTYLAEQAALGQAIADLEVKHRALERGEALIGLEAIAQQTLELRRAESRMAEAAVASARARVSRVEEQLHRFGLSDSDLARLTPGEGPTSHRVASHNVLRAPFAGVVTAFNAAPGESVQPDSELFTITDLSTVWVLADVYEKDLGQVGPATDVTVVVDTYPDRTFAGRITYVSDLIDPSTRTAKVRCVVPNQDGALKLDMFARVTIQTRARREVVAVPAAAVQQIDNQPVVFVQQSATRFVRRNVELGQTTSTLIEVRQGVEPGERIAASGSFYLKTALLRERLGDEH